MDANLFLKFIIVLVPLLALWYFSDWWLKHKSKILPRSCKSAYLQELDHLFLKPGCSIHLIKVAPEKAVLLAVSAGRTDMILTLDLKDKLLGGETN